MLKMVRGMKLSDLIMTFNLSTVCVRKGTIEKLKASHTSALPDKGCQNRNLSFQRMETKSNGSSRW